MISSKYYIWFLALTTIFNSCQEEHKEDSFTNQGVYDFTGDVITIDNPNDEAISYTFKLNETFPITIQDVLDSVYSISRDLGIDTAQAAWMYVVESTFHTAPFSENQWFHNDHLFINSATSGYCDDVATYLVKIWNKLGYKARVIGLEGHVVAEVFHQDKWKLYDPDLRVFFINQNKQVASLKELETDSSLIAKHSQIYLSPLTLSKETRALYNSYYKSVSNNIDNTKWALAQVNKLDTVYILPSNSSFTIKYDSLQALNFGTLQLTKESSGVLNIPLVPYCIEGELTYELNSHTLTLNAHNFSEFLNNYNQINITQVSENTQVHYIINPYLINLFKKQNKVAYKSSGFINIDTKKILSSNCKQTLSTWQMDKKLDQLKESKLVPYFEQVKNKPLHLDEMENDFILYSTFYPNKKTYADVLDFKEELIRQMNINENKLDQIILNYYPNSTFLIYSCLVEDNKAYLFDKLETLQEY